MNKFKVLWLVVAVISIITLVAGCGKTVGSSVGDKVTLKVEIFDRGTVPEGAGTINDNFMTKWVQENFGDKNNINMEFVPIPRSKEVDQLNVLMAAANAPDLVFTYDKNTIFNYVEQGGLTDLGPYIEKDGKDLKALLGDGVLKYGVFSGLQYTIPAKRMLVGMTGNLIRKDWLDKLGMKVPTTKEEFYNVLKAFKEKDPGNVGKDVIPYGASSANQGASFLSYLTQMTEEERYAGDMPGYKEYVRFMNKLYNEKLISPDFLLDKDSKKFYADVMAGKVGFFTDNLGAPLKDSPGTYSGLQKTVPEAVLVDCDPFENFEGKHVKAIYGPQAIYSMVPKASKRAAEVVKYLNWMAQPKVLFTLQNGIEGQNYTMENGFPKPIVTDESKKTFWYQLGFDLCLLVNGKYYEDPKMALEAEAKSVPAYSDLFMAGYASSIRDGIVKAEFDRPIKSEIKYSATLKNKSDELFIKSVTASPSDFDRIFDSIDKELDNLGRPEIRAEKIKAYHEMIGK